MGGQNEGGFSEEQLQMYKDCFKLMDINKDGQLDKNDLRGAFDNVGVLMSESELDGPLGEISGPCTYDNMVKMFQEKTAGEGNDPDDLIVQAFKAYDNEGKIDSKMFEHARKTWGDKMTKAEIDDIFGELEIDEDYMIKTKDVIGLFVSVKEEPKVEEPAPVEEVAEAEPEEDADAKKKKKKKKKASKLASFLYSYVKTLVAVEKTAIYEDSTFHRKEGQYEAADNYLPHPNNIVRWCSTLTDISFIMNSQFTNKVILLWGMHFMCEEAWIGVLLLSIIN